MDLPRALQQARPGAQWSIGDDYTSLQWIGPGEKPTLEELETAWTSIVNPPPAPLVVTKRSLLLKLTEEQQQSLDAGLSAMPPGEDKRKALIYYKESTTVARTHLMVTFFGSLLNLDSAGLDALFEAAKEQDILESSYL